MITTLRTNIRDPQRRKVFYARFGGKVPAALQAELAALRYRLKLAARA